MLMRFTALGVLLVAPLLCVGGEPAAPQAVVRVDVDKVLNHITPLMYGACIEDVNHEIYGGLYAQMIFGESFEEPPRDKSASATPGLSGMWDAIQTGTAQAHWTWDSDHPF